GRGRSLDRPAEDDSGIDVERRRRPRLVADAQWARRGDRPRRPPRRDRTLRGGRRHVPALRIRLRRRSISCALGPRRPVYLGHMSQPAPTLRETNLDKLGEQRFDVLVLGGGINGAVSAAALAARGAKVALIERGDFASVTSQQSSNLAWGGIKYLETFELALVRKLCRARNKLIRSYPSTVQEIRFYTSHERGFRHGRLALILGAWLYWLIGSFFTRRPRLLVNACGPYADLVNARDQVRTAHRHVFSKGIHILVDRLTPNHRVLTFFADDGRLFFVIPMGNKTCIGTTDTRVDEPEVEVTPEDRRFVLDNINKRLRLSRPLTESDIIAER